MALWLLLGSLLYTAVMGYVTYRYDIRNGEEVPFKISIMEWLSRSHHWHSFGHYFMDFVMTLFAGGLAWSIFTPWVSAHPATVAFLAMVPSTLLTLYVEIVGDKHWKSFVGKDTPADTLDFLFDLYTHLSGGLVGTLFLWAFMVL